MQIRIEDLVAAVVLVAADPFISWTIFFVLAAMFLTSLGYLAFDDLRKG